MNAVKQDAALKKAVRLLAERCPRLVKACYWAGTSAVSIEELGHRQSFDLDFHTCKAFADVRPFLAEIQRAFRGRFELIQSSDAFGSGFRGALTLPGTGKITIEVLSNYEDVSRVELVKSSVVSRVRRVSLTRYLADKIQCVAERAEARDLVDILAVVRRFPKLTGTARRLLSKQDALILAERLLNWTDQAVKRDLSVYPDVNPHEGIRARDLLLQWLKSSKE
ncbi:MAG: hypothetical protein HY360_18145 [Verrucomicrobia bacterium]|nr:hypothetical protein [Verrucomicrobiota bacterium]